MYGSPCPLWNQDEKCIAVFHERRQNDVLDHVRRWPKQFVSRVVFLFSHLGVDGTLWARFDEAPEISNMPYGDDAPAMQVRSDYLQTAIIACEQELSEITWSALIANTHRAFQIVVIGPKTPPGQQVTNNPLSMLPIPSMQEYKP